MGHNSFQILSVYLVFSSFPPSCFFFFFAFQLSSCRDRISITIIRYDLLFKRFDLSFHPVSGGLPTKCLYFHTIIGFNIPDASVFSSIFIIQPIYLDVILAKLKYFLALQSAAFKYSCVPSDLDEPFLNDDTASEIVLPPRLVNLCIACSTGRVGPC